MSSIKLLAFPLSMALLLVLPTGCPCVDAKCNNGVGGGSGGGSGGTGGGAADVYTRFTLDSTMSDRYYMEIVTDPARNRVGVAYVTGKGEVPIIYGDDDAGLTGGPATNDGGNYDIKYVEWEDGVVKPPQNVDVVRRMVGLSIDFNPISGEPAIGYLGGGSDMSVYWYNSDAMLATRTGTTWSKDTAALNGFQVTCGNPVSDQAAGVVVGLWSAIRHQADGTLWYCYRDVHTAQYPQGDWAGADVECVHGGPANWTRECAWPGGNVKNAPGGRIQMLMINDVPYIFWDQVFGGGDTSGQNVWMQNHTGNPPTMWSPLLGVYTAAGTQHGVSVDYDSMEGIGAALLDTTDNILRYTNKALSATRFNNADQIYGDGTGGWYPSLAMDKINHEPAVAYYVCSARGQQNAAQCQPEFDEVRVAQRINNDWAGHTETVDTVSVTTLKLGFLPDGRKVIVYREKDGTLKLAVRKVP